MSADIAPSATAATAPEGPLLVLNCGSSSIKFALFETATLPLPRRPAWSGKVDGIGAQAVYSETGAAPAPLPATPDQPDQPYHAALAHIRAQMLRWLGPRALGAVAHRVVHGGSKYRTPARIDGAVLADLRSYIPLAPLHQPFALEAVELMLADHPDLPQVACFDTGFHHTVAQVEQMFGLPYAAWERGLRRYGFHGLSYEYLSIALPERHGSLAQGRVIAAHLGSGASLCALRQSRSVATTMGFSSLDGLMMGTRCGAIDPGALLYLMETEGYTPARLGHLLYHESGLLGVSGSSSDPAVLLPMAATDGKTGARARLAMDLYVHRIVREIGALTALLGGLDLLVFTAGIGEHNAALRQRVCAGLEFVGVRLDLAANARHAAILSAADSKTVVAIEPTNEEWVAARGALALLAPVPARA